LDINEDWITQTTSWLCNKWKVTNFHKHTVGAEHIYTWQCDNNWNPSDLCRADQEWCGDGTKNWNEQCDDWAKNGTSDSLCSKTCKTVSSVSCGTKHGW
jgi:cysteine-rich repeat protein